MTPFHADDSALSKARLSIVGLGPGSPELLTPQARIVLEQSQAILGYHVYINLIPTELLAGKQVLASGMRREVERCTQAVEMALQGVDTVLVSSGDSGIYGMAGPCLEVLEQRGMLDKVDVTVVPGIPALAAAAALLGAPLMHDFAVISLSDLLTPWERILERIKHAARADFVMVLYNPRSRGRDWQLATALEVMAAYLAPETPVGLVRNAYRAEQEVSVWTLATLPVARVDMLSIVFIGNSQTRALGAKLLTPRGYPLG
ncbi:precorrin-3B C(17)-methyltransferase [Desulfonatronum thioautotrophicum]|uniref:precorrin-3B C(17)-methyltransferase n=1 Tax=Desulfonatronum thioautotrophicum TaxID=617001 RepID=UPI0005EAFF27|nr:precorrin-3B C(17)-methyltransferase [Desulfonatronum thioautotrophicum]